MPYIERFLTLRKRKLKRCLLTLDGLHHQNLLKIMWLKNPTNFNQWRFVLLAPNKEEVVLRGKNMHDLANIVIRQISQWDGDGYEYSKLPRQEAETLGIDWYNYILRNIQHQICLRLPESECWKGAGDNLHSFFGGIDKLVDSLPSPVRAFGQAATKAMTLLATGTAQAKFSGCRTCGGGRRMQPDAKNLGRKELLN
jgi:hypothetical protein